MFTCAHFESCSLVLIKDNYTSNQNQMSSRILNNHDKVGPHLFTQGEKGFLAAGVLAPGGVSAHPASPSL